MDFYDLRFYDLYNFITASLILLKAAEEYFRHFKMKWYKLAALFTRFKDCNLPILNDPLWENLVLDSKRSTTGLFISDPKLYDYF